jgi:hypothetical protein
LARGGLASSVKKGKTWEHCCRSGRGKTTTQIPAQRSSHNFVRILPNQFLKSQGSKQAVGDQQFYFFGGTGESFTASPDW